MYNRYLQQSAPPASCPPPAPPPCPEEKTGKPGLSGLLELFGKNGGVISTELLLLLAVLCLLLLDSDGALDTELLLIAGLLLLLGL